MAKVTLDLTGDWLFKEYPVKARRMRDLDKTDWLGTSVPGAIYTSLIGAGQITASELAADPEKFTHISEKPWVFKKTFDVSEELLCCDEVNLLFEGLDTIASIWLNEHLIGKTNNMFIGHRFEIKGLLKANDNIVLVKFDPAAEYAKKLMARYTRFKESDFLNPYRVYIRKAQYQFGWDFCPSLPGCGIWRPVKLEGVEKAQVRDVQVRVIECNDKYADVKIALELDMVEKCKYVCRLVIRGGNDKFEQELFFDPGEKFHSTVIHISGPALWQPRGYGEQNLYQLEITLLCNNKIIDSVEKTFGIRTAKLNLHNDRGTSDFSFEINGRKVYAKGANIIPLSIFAGSQTSGDYEKLLLKVVECNMNMVRIWGGGYYPDERFYQLCDRLGIMVWQDFMFACGYYPDRKWFYDQIKTESLAIIKQLRNHPSLVLWCGNNEIDWMHREGKLGKSKKFYGKDIYHKLLSEQVSQLDPDRSYIPTTPLSEKKKFDSEKMLAIHNWNVWSCHEPVYKYSYPDGKIPRFVTEFGFQSVPVYKTVEEFCTGCDIRTGSSCFEKHNYQDDNSRLNRYTADMFGPVEDLRKFIYLSQLTQARAVKTHVEYLRAHKHTNNGVLFWQLNDCCPAISWSAIDHKQRLKALYYYAKRFFAPRLPVVTGCLAPLERVSYPIYNSLSVIAINDFSEPLTATLTCCLSDLYGNVLDRVRVPVVLGPYSNSRPIKLPKALCEPARPEESCLRVSLEDHEQSIVKGIYFYLPDKYINWPKAQINTSFTKVDATSWTVNLKSNCLAKDVYLSIDRAVRLSDNFFDIGAGEEIELRIDCENPIESLESVMTVQQVNSVLANEQNM